MAEGNFIINRFNRGEVSLQALGRIDIERLADSAELMTNWMPQRLGSMMLRAGTRFLGEVPAISYSIPFIKSTNDKADLEFSEGKLRVWVGDAVIERAGSAVSIVNGDFSSGITSWNNVSGTGATASGSAGSLLLQGTGFESGSVFQDIATTIGEPFSLRIIVREAAIELTLGETSQGREIFSGRLEVGTHSLKINPETNLVSINLSNSEKYRAFVDSIEVESLGVMELPVNIQEADLPYLRFAQSADVIFFAVKDKPHFIVERRGVNSWSVVDYRTNNGAFGIINTTETTLQSSALSGNAVITSSVNKFTEDHVGVLYQLNGSGQKVTGDFTGSGQETDSIRITGVSNQEDTNKGGSNGGNFFARARNAIIAVQNANNSDPESSRDFHLSITGSFSATVTLQRSIGAEGDWEDVAMYTTTTTLSIDDKLDNQIVYYRVVVKDGEYTSGTIRVTLLYTGGTSSGIARVTNFISETQVDVQILEEFGAIDATNDWYESQWSDFHGWPSSVALFEGRLCWAGKNYIWCSVSDSYKNFSVEVEGDSAAIIRSIGYGAVDSINWLLSMNRLIMGTTGSEVAARSTSFDEPLTPSNFNLKDTSTQGSKEIDIARVDNSGFFVQRSGTRLYELKFSYEVNSYSSTDKMSLNPEIALSGIKKIVVQRQPDTRIHMILNDGTVIILVYDEAEGVNGFVRYETQGEVIDAIVLPEVEEDAVYYTVKRFGKYFKEKWALQRECVGGAVSNHKDSFVNSSVGLEHLEGQTVSVWQDGREAGDYEVLNGELDFTGKVTLANVNLTVGLSYTAQYKSSKIAYAAVKGTALTQRKRIKHLGFILLDLYPSGFQYGSDFTRLRDLPRVENGRNIEWEATLSEYDEEQIPFDGTYDSDSRICLQASSPVTVLAIIPQVDTKEK